MRFGHCVILTLIPVAASGCGYHMGSMYRSDIDSVYIEMFQSHDFRRGIEMQLTEALRKQIDRATPYKNAPKNKADSILTGEILDWRENTLGRDFVTDLPRETAGTLAVRYRWQDQRTGKILVEQPRLVETVTYVRPLGESVQDGREQAVNALARRIAESMESPW